MAHAPFTLSDTGCEGGAILGQESRGSRRGLKMVLNVGSRKGVLAIGKSNV
jgi:hypothetical protein